MTNTESTQTQPVSLVKPVITEVPPDMDAPRMDVYGDPILVREDEMANPDYISEADLDALDQYLAEEWRMGVALYN